jgi:hypothetical protein
MPFISLLAALVMRSSERRPSRRSFLKNWAIASGAVLGGWLLIVIVVVASVAGHSGAFGGGCKGGVDPFAVPTTFIQQSGSRHSMAVVPCRLGGTTTRQARPGENPFGG